jgi:ribosomal-protein-alanine N-acetyltransferase
MAYGDAFKEFPVLTTKRLLLDALVPADACALQQQMQGIPPYSMWPAPFAEEKHARMRIGHHAAAYKKKGNIHWAIRTRRSKKLIGLCKLFELEYAFRAEVGYWITKKMWNKGYGTEAIGEITRYGLEVMELHRIYAHTSHENHGSKRMLERIGYRQEGCLKDHVIYDGSFQDMLLYAIVKNPDDPAKWLDKPWASR